MCRHSTPLRVRRTQLNPVLPCEVDRMLKLGIVSIFASSATTDRRDHLRHNGCSGRARAYAGRV